jgi:hypothetical protein
MPLPIVLKRSGVAATAPNSLVHGELALNYADGLVYWKDSSNTIRNFSLVAGVPASPSFTGNSTFTASSGVPVVITNTGTDLSFRVNDESGDTSPFVVDAAGNVGIGTSTVSANMKLDVRGAALFYRTTSDGLVTVQGLQTSSGGTGKAAIQIDVNGQGGFAWQCDATGTKTLRLINNNGYGAGESTLLTVTSAGVLAVGGNTVLHAGNYNSYSPTLTGTGASGTWSINVTGSAGSATTCTYQVGSGTANNFNTNFTETPTHNRAFREMSAGGPQGAWWFVENMRHSNGSNYWGRQNAWGWEDNANELWSRNVQGGTWGSWVRFIHSGNYNSYAPTLTGGGASGTWGISVTGTANSETLNTVCSRGVNASGYGPTFNTVYTDNWFRSNGTSGWFSQTYGGGIWMTDSTYVRVYNNKQFYADSAITSATAMYAPIYYDSQNAAYYCDPNGTSRFAGMNIDSLQVFGEYLYVGKSDTATFSTIAMRDSNEGERILHCNSNRIGFLTQAGAWGSWCNDDGSWQSAVAMYAPIYYDSDNSGYWVNPANGGYYLRGGTSDRVTYFTADYGTAVYNAEGTGTYVRVGAAWGRPGVYNNTSFTVGAETQIDFVIANNVLMSIASSGAITHNSTPGFLVRAWAKFDASTSPTLLGSGNVSSITYRSAAGKYRVNFTTSIPNHLACLGNVGNATDTFTNTTMRMGVRNVVSGRATYQDINIVSSGGQGVPSASDAMAECSFIAVS